MLIHSTTTFDIAVAAHRTRVASAMTHRRVEQPWQTQSRQSQSSSASAARQRPLSEPRVQTSGPSPRSVRGLAQ